MGAKKGKVWVFWIAFFWSWASATAILSPKGVNFEGSISFSSPPYLPWRKRDLFFDIAFLFQCKLWWALKPFWRIHTMFLTTGTRTLLILVAGLWWHAHLKTWSLACKSHCFAISFLFFIMSGDNGYIILGFGTWSFITEGGNGIVAEELQARIYLVHSPRA